MMMNKSTSNYGNKHAPSVTVGSTTASSFASSSYHGGGASTNWNLLSNSSSSGPAVLTGRLAFLFTLMSVAATFGSLSFYLLTKSEHQLTEEQFASIADRATCSAMEATERKRLGTQSLASVIGGANPTADQWPLVTLNNYENIATNLIHTSKGCNMAFAPFVEPHELQEFEDFIYDYYQHKRMPHPWANGTAIQSSFGKGVWAKDEHGNIVHDINGTTNDWGSPHPRLIAPMIHHNTGPSKKLMYNLHSTESRGSMMDDMIQCAQHKAQTGASLDDCVVISPIVANKTSWVLRVENGPGASMMQPVYPANDPTKLVGVVVTGIVWSEIMMSTYSDSVTGIDIVLSDGTQEFTYKVLDGQTYLQGKGDLHDRKFDSYAHTLDMTSPEFFGPTSSHYTLTLYPTQELYDVYSTPNPIIAGFGAVCIIAFTSVLFLLYDLSVRREFHAKKELLEAKRRFCRFVSHEVRTPLNSVCMGLTLMTEEMSAAVQKQTTSAENNNRSTDKNSGNNCSSWLTLAEEISANANSAVNVLNEFLNYDKVQSGKLTLEYSVVPIFDLVERTASEFKVPAAKKNIKLIVQTPVSTPNNKDVEEGQQQQERYLVGDKVRLTMVVRNLISNALKFTPEQGTVTVCATWAAPSAVAEKQRRKSITTATQQQQQQVQFELANQPGQALVCTPNGTFHLSVTDTGVGMTPDQIKTVFKQGSQFNVNQLQAGKGSGLGTWIAKGIIRQHGGLLSATSEGLSKGSTFSVNLPIHDIPTTHLPQVCCRSTDFTSTEKDDDYYDEAFEEEEFQIGTLNILCVDDAKMNLKLLTRLLEKHGHIVTQADDGDIAVGKVKETMTSGGGNKMFDVILMDYQMIRMNGPCAARKIREMGCDAFIVGVTGNVMPEDIRVFKEAGANAVLPKPIKIPDLESLWIEYGIRGDDEDDHDGDNDQLLRTEAGLQLTLPRMEIVEL